MVFRNPFRQEDRKRRGLEGAGREGPARASRKEASEGPPVVYFSQRRRFPASENRVVRGVQVWKKTEEDKVGRRKGVGVLTGAPSRWKRDTDSGRFCAGHRIGTGRDSKYRKRADRVRAPPGRFEQANGDFAHFVLFGGFRGEVGVWSVRQMRGLHPQSWEASRSHATPTRSTSRDLLPLSSVPGWALRIEANGVRHAVLIVLMPMGSIVEARSATRSLPRTICLLTCNPPHASMHSPIPLGNQSPVSRGYRAGFTDIV